MPNLNLNSKSKPDALNNKNNTNQKNIHLFLNTCEDTNSSYDLF